MNLFKTFTMTWWQAGIFKVGMWGAGISVGAYWHDFFSGYLFFLIAVAIVCLTYTTYAWAKQ
jgi:hypothetical protein